MRSSLEYVIFGYFASWSIYKSPPFRVWDIYASSLTHLNYAFASIDEGIAVLDDVEADIYQEFQGFGDMSDDPQDFAHGNIHQLYRLKQFNRNLKVGLSIGGWLNSKYFSEVAGSAANRTRFADSAIRLMMDIGMDYISLEWEYPVDGGNATNVYSPYDRENYLELVKEIKRLYALMLPDHEHFKLVITLPCDRSVYARKYNLPEMAKYVDYFQVMCHDFVVPDETRTQLADHHANLFPRPASRSSSKKQQHGDLAPSALSVSDAIESLLTQVPSTQLVLSVPMFGRSWVDTDGILKPGVADNVDEGIYPYYRLPLLGDTVYWETATNSSFSYNPMTRRFVTFETTKSLSYKLKYVTSKKLAGISYWELSMGSNVQDHSSKSGLQGEVKRWLGKNVKREDNRLCYPMSSYGNLVGSPTDCPDQSMYDYINIGSSELSGSTF